MNTRQSRPMLAKVRWSPGPSWSASGEFATDLASIRSIFRLHSEKSQGMKARVADMERRLEPQHTQSKGLPRANSRIESQHRRGQPRCAVATSLLSEDGHPMGRRRL